MKTSFAIKKNNKQSSCCSHFIFIFLFLLISSCSHSPQKFKVGDTKEIVRVTNRLKPSSSFADTITIHFPAAVFYNPDSLQLQQIKSVTDSVIFESAMHEFFYQQRYAHILLKKYYPKLKIYEVKNARYLLFKKARGKTALIDLNLKNDACGLFVFDGHKDPLLIDMTNADSQLGFYFSK